MKVLKIFDPNKFPVYYHYCSIETLEKILASKALWLTKIDKSNDDQEIRHLFLELLPRVKERIILVGSDSSRERTIRMFDCAKSVWDCWPVNIPYCTCFSNHGNLTEQWNKYAANGTGVSLGFAIDYFDIPREPPYPTTDLYTSIGFCEVYYHENKEELLFEKFNEILSNISDDLQCLLALGKCATIFSPTFKEKNFEMEEESRIIYFPHNSHKCQNNVQFISKLEIEPQPHFSLSWWRGFNCQALSEVILGPNCALSKDELIGRLKLNEIIPLDTEFTLSNE